ncbi:LysR family transcriptional regulator [Exilibacterium tricleocarpae]|uniref:LysR family transcriptional regulator n=1 Tax=Exilibacterium tricleocarpae TaxID=2591008 RepID=A0A545TZK0_9GAMM|nr:LysR substrate-binding domain-containing protein [Exilibacterium tricleocarpae]TQV82644.1 LysR family transcriptional regulator [Exilibacterium tricleocarpae]
MNIRDLRYFLAVAELEHFGQAADQCCVSQPTLSGQIKKLEEQLGVTLFERTNRRVMLTEVGEHIAHSARRILREVDTVHDIAKSSHDPLAGKFRLGAFPTLATYIFPNLVPRAKAAMPNIRLILIEEKTANLIEKLRHGEIDAALLALPVYDDFLVSHKLFDDEFLLAVPPDHELTKHPSIDQKTLKKQRLLLLEEGHCLRDQALDICRPHGIAEEQDFKATGMETLRQMVKAGTGITFMPKIAIQENEPGIHYIPFTAPAPIRTIGLVWRKTTTRQPVMDRLIESISSLGEG